jgi:hypothetical protein
MTSTKSKRRMPASACSAVISMAICLLIAVAARAADLRLVLTVVPAYRITVVSGGQAFATQGTGEVAIRVPAGPARLRVIKTNSVSPRFRLECDGSEILKSGQYGADLQALLPGIPGSEVQLALKTD